MQRVVSINLNGNAYQLEENGYNALFAFLDATEAQLKDDPNRAQLLADLEQRVAEQCKACLSPHKTVVTSHEIDRIIAELGPAQGQPGANTSQTAGAAQETSSGSGGAGAGTGTRGGGAGTSSGAGRPYAHRRLYQIREGSMISGVCMGLAEYLHVDVTFIRILFVIFALVTTGWGMLAYGVLMFVVPRVQTRADAANAQDGSIPPHRWPWDDGWPWDKHGWPWDHNRPATAAPPPPPGPGAPPPSPAPFPPGSRREWRAQRRAERMHYGAGSFWGFFGLLACIMVAFFWLSLWTRGHFFYGGWYGWPFFWGFPHWIGIVIFFMVMRLIFMPFRMARWHGYGYGYGPYAHPHHAWAMMWNGLAWFVVMIFAVWAAYHYIPEVHDFIRNLQTGWNDGDFHI